MDTFKPLKALPANRRVLTNEELTLAVLNLKDFVDYAINALLVIIDLDRSERLGASERSKPPDADAKINELARLRANLKDRPYG